MRVAKQGLQAGRLTEPSKMKTSVSKMKTMYMQE